MAKKEKQLKDVNEPAYGYAVAIFMSFYSKYLYLDVAKRWRGFGLLYLLLIIAVCVLPVSMKSMTQYSEAYDQQIIQPLSLLPTIYIQGGVASFDKPMPYLIKNSEGKVVDIIDTTGKVTEKTTSYPDLSVLVTKHNIQLYPPTPVISGYSMSTGNDMQPLKQDFSEQMNVVFDGKFLINDNEVLKIKSISQWMIYPLLASVFYGIFLVILLVIGFLGQIFSQVFFSYSISFKKSSRLLMVAATPALVILCLLLALGLLFPGSGYFLVAIMTAYYSFALYHVKKDSGQLVLT